MTPSTQRRLIFALISTGLVIVGFFGLRARDALREFRGHRPPSFNPGEGPPAETDVELIRDWMTIPFISKMYRVPPRILFDALEVPREENGEKSLAQLNEEYFSQAPGIVMEIVKAALRANQPPPTGLPPLTPLPSLTPVLP